LQITDGILRENPHSLPDVYQQNQKVFHQFNSGGRFITNEILSCLSDVLGLQGVDRFESCHRPDFTRNCSLSIHRYPRAEINASFFGQNKHTDSGSLTMLFINQPGLQMQSPRTGTWGKVTPQPGHTVVNVGDMLRFLSGFKFKSAVHRVIPEWLDGQQDRIAIGFFLRAEDEKTLQDNEGKTNTARQWLERKFANYKADHAEQRKNSILTAGMEELNVANSQLK
jgi:isopenicillin N synthase-like dioxygenase